MRRMTALDPADAREAALIGVAVRVLPAGLEPTGQGASGVRAPVP
ncbi:hypothetical protein [Spongiactinospora sp. TRM90649]|nr:hypothetical protein [Spongiactinospora sp. TRM90649]MDF5753621.1 hypothetical protein [Spongiactinospora sp. TRM90649]